jgi:hypothetical protein
MSRSPRGRRGFGRCSSFVFLFMAPGYHAL